ncbi:testis-expressed protein 9-like [Clavelina lepadiformis]|uniref:testis-expressed protein 9-like n=1 Tax=Clavelina lepadiformis TaxID=159417 RepID=UPI004042DED0
MASFDKTKKLSNSPSLIEREKEYQRLNAQLEAQTAKLVEEAENMMKKQDNFLKQVSPSQSFSAETNIQTITADTDTLSIGEGDAIESYVKPSAVEKPPALGNMDMVRPKGSKKSARKLSARRDVKQNKPKQSQRQSFNAEASTDFDLIFSKSNEAITSSRFVHSVMPEMAEEMSSEAQLTFLKAKVRVMQEELEAQAKELQSVSDERNKYRMELKTSREEAERLKKNFLSLEGNVQKLKSGLEDAKKKADTKAQQFQSVTKEIDALKREKKQAATTQSATEVRLNRAIEENEKLKAMLEKQKHSSKDRNESDHHEIERLQAENKRMERLRNDSLTVITKQLKLIGVLKKQVLHIEAAKLLSFTEEEFMKALDWGNA